MQKKTGTENKIIFPKKIKRERVGPPKGTGLEF
jgi:hypothetical protein